MPTHLPLLWLDLISSNLSLSPVPTRHSRHPSPTANFSVPLSHSLTGVPFLLPVTSRSQVQNPLSGFVPKQTKGSSAWWTTYIVLQIKAAGRKGWKFINNQTTSRAITFIFGLLYPLSYWLNSSTPVLLQIPTCANSLHTKPPVNLSLHIKRKIEARDAYPAESAITSLHEIKTQKIALLPGGWNLWSGPHGLVFFPWTTRAIMPLSNGWRSHITLKIAIDRGAVLGVKMAY